MAANDQINIQQETADFQAQLGTMMRDFLAEAAQVREQINREAQAFRESLKTQAAGVAPGPAQPGAGGQAGWSQSAAQQKAVQAAGRQYDLVAVIKIMEIYARTLGAPAQVMQQISEETVFDVILAGAAAADQERGRK